MASTVESQHQPAERMLAAVRAGDVPAVEALLAHDATLLDARDEQGVTVILLACYHQHAQLLERLLARHPLLDIWEAAAVGQAGRVSELLDRDAGLGRAHAPDGFTPLHLAAFFGHLNTARRLVRHGADVMAIARNAMQVQPLHSAAAGGHRDLVKYLLERGAAANARQAGGWTALHAAAASGDARMVRLLLAHGARSLAADDGATPADMARRNGHAGIAASLPRS